MTNKNILNKTMFGILTVIMMISLLLFPAKMQNNVHADTFLGEDLTNTIWEINENPDYYAGGEIAFAINFQSNGSNYVSFIKSNGNDTSEGITYWDGVSEGNNVYYRYYSNMIWRDNSYRQITITGGTHVTNGTLIDWLKDNAEYQGVYNPNSSQEQNVASTGIIENTVLATSITIALIGMTIIVIKSNKSKTIKN